MRAAVQFQTSESLYTLDSIPKDAADIITRYTKPEVPFA